MIRMKLMHMIVLDELKFDLIWFEVFFAIFGIMYLKPYRFGDDVMKNEILPILKWVGGKRQLMGDLTPLLPDKINIYYEPFVGGGAMLFHVKPEKAYISDINRDLIRVYNVVKSNVDMLIDELKKYNNTADKFYEVRSWDRDEVFYAGLTDVQKAARILFLNKTCYNGLYRVNSKGQFNTPFGKYDNPDIVNESGLRAVHDYFNKASIQISSISYSDVIKNVFGDAFVYLDPPYDPVSKTANFTGYSVGGFSKDDQIRLREYCDELTARGVKFMLSNSATDFILDQYSAYDITTVKAKRCINSVASKRSGVDEVVIRNYK